MSAKSARDTPVIFEEEVFEDGFGASKAYNPYDEFDQNERMTVLNSTKPLDGILNTVSHYFSSNVIFLYTVTFVLAAGWMLLVVFLLEETTLLDEFRAGDISLAFGTLGFLVPLIINRWGSEAEGGLEGGVRTFSVVMEIPGDLARALEVVCASARYSGSNTAIIQEYVGKMFQITKILHYLNYAIHINGRIDVILEESYIQKKQLSEPFLNELTTLILRQNPIDITRRLLVYGEIETAKMLHQGHINQKQFDRIDNHFADMRLQATSMAVGSISSRNKLLKNHNFLVLLVYLSVVIPVQLYDVMQRYAPVFYGLQIVLLLGPILIPVWLGSAHQNSRRFKDKQYLTRRNNVFGDIFKSEKRCLSMSDV